MKTSIKLMLACFLAASFAVQSFGQSMTTSNKTTSTKPKEEKKGKIEKTKVPKVVTETYIIEYPGVVYDSWYGYPAFADESDWYAYDPYLYTDEYPEYYIVEFTKEKTPHKAMYNKSGKKVATHKKTMEVPQAVTNSVNKSEYKDWTVKKEKEEILRESDKMKVYKVVVEKGTEKHALFYREDGTLLKDKTIKS